MEKYYCIKTYGCQMNIHESEKLAGVLKGLGYLPTEELAQADIIVFNTCCIRESAEQKIFGNIGMVKGLKKKNPNLIVAVCGCMAQENGTAETIRTKFPFVNILFGTHNLYLFEDYVKKYTTSHSRVFEVWDKEQKIVEDSACYRTSGQNAWVNITFGCNNFCTYCIVPYVRGRERSRDMEEIVGEVTKLVQVDGYKTITLLGQNVNSYGNDIDDPEVTFAKLLDRLCKIDGDFRIKFLTSHPKDLNDDVIEVIASNDKMSKTIHLPCQSGSTSILSAMNRRYTRENYIRLIDKIYARIPNVSLTSDFIVGFPGETDEDFEDTCSLVEHCRYNSIFAFMYSKRKGTVAEKMDHQVPIDTKRKRVNQLLALQKSITKQINDQLQGKVVEVLIEGKLKDGVYSSKTDNGKTVEVLSVDSLDNNFYRVKIQKIYNNKLQAIVEEK